METTVNETTYNWKSEGPGGCDSHNIEHPCGRCAEDSGRIPRGSRPPNFNPPATQEQSGLMQIEQTKAIQEIQSALVIAKRFPRDVNAAFARIMQACDRISLANKAIYNFPRASASVTGPTIRLMEVIAQNYGNLEYGIKELERRPGMSVAQAFCWDMETNVRSTITFEVPHEIEVGRGRDKKVKKLTDPRDIYEIMANNGSRRVRSRIQAIVPPDIIEEAVARCRRTIARGDGTPLGDRVRLAVVAFQSIGVSQEMVEERLKHAMDLTTAEELVDLLAIYNSIKDKQAKRTDFFNFPEKEIDEETEGIIAAIEKQAEGEGDVQSN